MRFAIMSAVLVGLLSLIAPAQPAATGPAGGRSPSTQPDTKEEALEARIVKLAGSVSYALVDKEGKTGEWKDAKVGDRLPAGTQIRTRLRAKVVLAFGDDSVIEVNRATLASIDQFSRTQDTKRIKLGLGHGMIRGGVAETTLRSDLTIETPTATLSKAGTIGFGIEYQPVTGRFRVFLEREGLVEALNKSTGRSGLVRPGQYITERMIAWIETLTTDRWVPVVDTTSMTDAEQVFNTIQNSGLTVVEPGGGSQIMTLSGRDAGALAAQVNQQRQQIEPSPVTPGTTVIDRGEGNFGTGSGFLQGARRLRR